MHRSIPFAFALLALVLFAPQPASAESGFDGGPVIEIEAGVPVDSGYATDAGTDPDAHRHSDGFGCSVRPRSSSHAGAWIFGLAAMALARARTRHAKSARLSART